MIIDVHTHIGLVVKDRKEFMDVTSLIIKMDAWGIDKACVLGLSETPEAVYRESDTEDVISACLKFPDRLIPFCLIDPRFGSNNQKMDFTYLFEEYASRGCKGIGELLPKMEFDDPRCLNLYRQAGKFKMPVLFDMNSSKYGYGLIDDPGLPKLEKALQKCPQTVFIGHGPTFWAEISADVPESERCGYPKGPIKKGGTVPKLMKKYENIWADISAGSGYNALSRDPEFGLKFLKQFQDKLLFGTDSCLRSDIEKGVPVVRFFKKILEDKLLPEETWQKIASKNAKRILKLVR